MVYLAEMSADASAMASDAPGAGRHGRRHISAESKLYRHFLIAAFF
jgi:hypothetical protein